MSQTMTETAPPKSKSKQPLLFTISETNETLFKIKQVATGAHFVALILLGFLYVAEHDQVRNVFIFAACTFVLAMFIPPTGMIQPDDAPEYAKNSMNYIPQNDGTVGPIMPASKRKDGKKTNAKKTK